MHDMLYGLVFTSYYTNVLATLKITGKQNQVNICASTLSDVDSIYNGT